MLDRDQWLDLARKLDWDLSYVTEQEAYPVEISGTPWLPHTEWSGWDEPYRTSYAEYVAHQHDKDVAVHAVRDAVGRVADYEQHDRSWPR
jgi:toluene monooxygenase system protein A